MERVVSTVRECSSFFPEVATGTNSLQTLHFDTHQTISSSENESGTSSKHWPKCACLHGRAVLSWVSTCTDKPWPQQREIACADSRANRPPLLSWLQGTRACSFPWTLGGFPAVLVAKFQGIRSSSIKLVPDTRGSPPSSC